MLLRELELLNTLKSAQISNLKSVKKENQILSAPIIILSEETYFVPYFQWYWLQPHQRSLQ